MIPLKKFLLSSFFPSKENVTFYYFFFVKKMRKKLLNGKLIGQELSYSDVFGFDEVPKIWILGYENVL